MTLDVQDVSKNFGPVSAVRDLSLEVAEGETLSLMGPSGCGKTTVLRMIAGLEAPSSGRILLNGAPVRRGSSALVFQDAPLYPHLTVEQNVRFPLTLRAGRGTPDARRRVDEALELLRIGPLAHRRPHELSGGQKQRVGIARGVVRDVGVYLFDEPLAHLDEALARDILSDVRSLLAERRLTCVYVTHSSREAFALGGTAAVMDGGTLMQRGTAEQLWRSPSSRFVAEFLGSAPMNFVERDDVLLGFRPDEAAVRAATGGAEPGGAETTSGLSLRGRLLDRAYLGEFLELAFRVEPDAEVRVRLCTAGQSPVPDLAPGEEAVIEVEGTALHPFDPATGQRRATQGS